MTNYERQLLMEVLLIKKELALLNNDLEAVKDIENQVFEIKNGYTAFYELEEDVLSNEKDEEWFSFIYEVLEMYSRMINSIGRNQYSTHLLNLEDVKFPGFDGNNEIEEMNFVRHFIVDLNRYAEIEAMNKGDYNSHRKMKEIYKKMLYEFKQMGEPNVLTDDQIKKIIEIQCNEQIYR